MYNIINQTAKSKSILFHFGRNFKARIRFSSNISKSESFISLKRTSIRIRRVQLKERPKVLKFILRNLTSSEPIYRGVQIPEHYENYSPALVEFIRKSIEYGMTFIAVPNRLSTVSEAFGAVVNTKLVEWDTDNWKKFASCVKCPKVSSLLNLWGFLVKDCGVHTKYNTNKVFHIANVVTNENDKIQLSPDLSSDALAHILVDKSLRIAPLFGYKVAFLLCSSNMLFKTAEQLNMKLIYEFPYENLLNEKLEPIIKNLDKSYKAKIYIKEC